MKKLLILLMMIIATDSHSSGIGAGTSTAPCDNDMLSKYTGTVNAEINWEPNTINLKWFDGETELNVANASQSCTYDGMITVPPQPTKPGYTFNGWKIPKMDFGTIPTDGNATNRWGIAVNNNTEFCVYDTNTGDTHEVDCNSDSTYNELQTYEWKLRFGHGDLYGVGKCSITSGTHAQIGNPVDDMGRYCWCKAKGYKAANTSVIKGSVFALSWVFGNLYSSATQCMHICVSYCIYATDVSSVFRTALYTPAN